MKTFFKIFGIACALILTFIVAVVFSTSIEGGTKTAYTQSGKEVIPAKPTKPKINRLELAQTHFDSLEYGYAMAEAHLFLQEKDVEKADSIKALQIRDEAMKIMKKRIADVEKKKEAALKRLRVKKDEFSDIAFYYSHSTPRNRIYNDFMLYMAKGNYSPTLRFMMQYKAESWLFVKSVTVKADDQTFRLYPPKWKRDNSGGTIWEWSDEIFKAKDRDMIEAVINAKVAKIRYHGSTYYDDRTISSKKKKALKEVLGVYDLLKADEEPEIKIAKQSIRRIEGYSFSKSKS